MPMNDIEDLMEQRIKGMEENDQELVAEYEVMGDGDWGLITVFDMNGLPIEFDFVESETSWQRLDAIDNYNELADEGYQVTIIVPDDSFLAVSRMVQMFGNPDISLVSQEDLEIAPRERIVEQ